MRGKMIVFALLLALADAAACNPRYAAFAAHEARSMFPYLPGRIVRHAAGGFVVAADDVVLRYDEAAAHMDYFVHSDRTIHRCVWHGRLCTSAKRRIFAELRDWWPHLRAELRDTGDAQAWLLSDPSSL